MRSINFDAFPGGAGGVLILAIIAIEVIFLYPWVRLFLSDPDEATDHELD